MPTYISQYPTQDDDHVKATTKNTTSFWPYFATDPAKTLTGEWGSNSWLAVQNTVTDQRFHIDLGSAKLIKRIYYENGHTNGTVPNSGAQNFTFWGSNTGAGTFDDLVYGNDEGWTELTVAQNTFDIHVSADQADPKYIVVTNVTAYRYYAFKFADNHGNTAWLNIRRIELQTEGIALTATVTITTSTTSVLSRGITVPLTATSTITTSITSALSRGITAVLTSTSAITTSTTASLSRGIKVVLTSTVNIATSTTSALSRGITQALTSTVNITTSILARLFYDWWEESKSTIDWTEETKTEISWTEEDKGEIDWDEEEK